MALQLGQVVQGIAPAELAIDRLELKAHRLRRDTELPVLMHAPDRQVPRRALVPQFLLRLLHGDHFHLQGVGVDCPRVAEHPDQEHSRFA